MKTTLLAIAAAALLSGSAAAYAQTGAPGDQTRDHRAQPADQTQQPNAASPMQPGATGRGEMRPEGAGPQTGAPETNQNRQMERTQLPANRNQTQYQGRERLQGGEMLRGGEMRGEGARHPLTIRERTNLRETVLRSGPRVTHVNFRIGVGARVPRSVRLVAVPQPILAIYPEWANDLYFDYGDEVVVVQPDTMEIVGVLPL
ncbi:MAG TPA: DUF1236 domain-containing protein [Rhizomicrobium sp.]